jgi:hypothetical protein
VSTPIEAITPPRLRLLSIGDLLDESVRLYRRNWIRLVTIAAIITVPLTVLELAFAFLSASVFSFRSSFYSPSYGDPTTRWLIGQSGQIILSLISVGLNGIMLGALVLVAGQSYLGRPVSTGQAYRLALRRFRVMIGTFILFLLILLLLLVATLFPCVGWLGGPSAIVFMMVNLSALIVPVIMLESRGVLASLRRSWLLSKSQFWRILLILVVLYLFNMVLVGGPTWVIAILVIALTNNPAMLSFVTVGMSTVVSLIFTPIWGVCVTLLYYDARVRREAFDLALIAGIEVPLDEEQEPLFVRSDWKTLGILTLITVPAAIVLLFLWPLFLVGTLGALGGF